MFAASRNRPSLLARLTALGAVLMVLALTALAASPELHARVHGHEVAAAPGHGPAADPDDDGCVVTLFAQGLVALLAFAGLVFFGRRVRPVPSAGAARILPAAPDYRLLPTQAPPVA